MSESALPAFSLDLFAPFVGHAFQIGEGDRAIAATLIEATSLREAQGAGQRSHQFSVIWRGPPGMVLEQRIYPVSHPTLPALELFLVCIGPDAEGMRYEAVFT